MQLCMNLCKILSNATVQGKQSTLVPMKTGPTPENMSGDADESADLGIEIIFGENSNAGDVPLRMISRFHQKLKQNRT